MIRPMTVGSLWWRKKPAKEQESEIQRIMRKVFNSEDGAVALATILEDLYFNREATTEGEMALKNYGTVLLRDRLRISTDTLATVVALLNDRTIKEKQE